MSINYPTRKLSWHPYFSETSRILLDVLMTIPTNDINLYSDSRLWSHYGPAQIMLTSP